VIQFQLRKLTSKKNEQAIANISKRFEVVPIREYFSARIKHHGTQMPVVVSEISG
jgi:hypothetical protein